MSAWRIMNKKSSLVILFILMASTSIIFSGLLGLATPASAQVEIPGLEKIGGVIDANFTQYIANLSRLGSRVTGYPGCNAAADYITDKFSSYGLQVVPQEYSVVVPLDNGSSVTVTQPVVKTLTAYAVWPNYVQASPTPSGGVEGPLVYVGTGELKELNGKVIKDSIVLMDFNSGRNWINAARFGAKAVIFTGTQDTYQFQETSKFLTVPTHLPRLYLSPEDTAYLTDLLNQGEVRVRVNSRMRYREVAAKNILGIVEGEIPDEIIVVGAHYDTWSAVPALAPGADEATSTALLLELARFFGKEENKPKRTLWFVALSGYWQALAGAREFVETNYFSEGVLSGSKRILLFIGLDLSTDNNKVAILYRGMFYDYGATMVLSRFNRWLLPQMSQVYFPALREEFPDFDPVTMVEDGFKAPEGYWASVPTPYMLDSEPVSVAGSMSFTIRTTETYRVRWLTHTDDLPFVNENIQKGKLRPQVIASSGLVYCLANEPQIGIRWEDVTPVRILYFGGAGVTREMSGFLPVTGRVLIYNYITNWYDPVPNALVVTTRKPGSTFWFQNIITFANQTGHFTLHGCGPGPGMGTLWSHSGHMGYLAAFAVGYLSEAFVFDSTTGMITYAPDLGEHGLRTITFWNPTDRYPAGESTTVIFKSTSVVVFDIFDPVKMQSSVVLDPRYADRVWPGAQTSIVLYPYDFRSWGEFLSWGISYSQTESVGVFYVPPETRFLIIEKIGATGEMGVFLVNATQDSPEGVGYYVPLKQEVRLTFPTLQFVENMFIVSRHRYSSLAAFNVRSRVAEVALQAAEKHIQAAKVFLQGLQYDRAYEESVVAWAWVRKAHYETMALINDASFTGGLFFVVLIPFVFVFERLLLSKTGLKRLGSMVALVVVCLVVIYLAHPSIKVLNNMAVGYLGTTLIFLFAVVLLIFVGELRRVITRIRESLIGPAYTQTTALDSTMFSLPVAIQNMKRRRLRSILVTTTIVIITFSLIALTSTRIEVEARVGRLATGAPYDGLLLKRGLVEPKDFLSPEILPHLKGVVGTEAVLSPRALYYPQSSRGTLVKATLYSSSGTYIVQAVVGLTPQEPELNPTFNDSLLQGIWFQEGSYQACILTQAQATSLGVQVGNEIVWGGITLRVVGILAQEILNSPEFIDLDQKPLTPLDPQGDRDIVMSAIPEEYISYLPWQNVLIIPYRLAMDLGANLASVAIGVPQASVEKAAREIAFNTNVGVYGAQNGTISLYSRTPTVTTGGWTFQVFPLVLGGLCVANTLFASIKEREREISIYSSTGLSPSGIRYMLLSEALIYASLGTLLGYLLGVIMNQALFYFRILPPDFILNFSSAAVVFALGVSILCVVGAALYPSLKASLLVTPSYERKWRIPTKPGLEEWGVPFPFRIGTATEVRGLLTYMKDIAESLTVAAEQPFVIRSVDISYPNLTLKMTVLVQPYEANVTQAATISAYQKEETYLFNVHIRRLTGGREVWIRANYNFLDIIRKQFLTWRALPPLEKEKYQLRAEEAA